MAEKAEWIVGGFQFETEKDARQAKVEEQKIMKLEEKMDYKNPHMVLLVYNKAIENRIFKTPVGYEYLRKLQKMLRESPLIRETVPDIPLYNLYNLRDSANPTVEKIKIDYKKRQKKETKEFLTRRMSIYLNFILVFFVLLMFYISFTGSKPTVLNYEKALVNKYAAWEQELTERERVVREKEKELDIMQ